MTLKTEILAGVTTDPVEEEMHIPYIKQHRISQRQGEDAYKLQVDILVHPLQKGFT